MFNWVENFWAQGACSVLSILIALFSGLTAFRYTDGGIYIIFFIINLVFAVLIFIGFHGWSNTIFSVLSFLVTLAFLIITLVSTKGFSDAVLMMILCGVSALASAILCRLCK